MRPVTALSLPAALTTARREAEASFGDGRLLIEKLITCPRHIEVQVRATTHGHLIHLLERDYLVQQQPEAARRSPAPNLSDATAPRCIVTPYGSQPP